MVPRSNSAQQPKAETKRFFSFAYAFPEVDREWTGAQAVSQWLHVQLGTWLDASEALAEPGSADKELLAAAADIEAAAGAAAHAPDRAHGCAAASQAADPRLEERGGPKARAHEALAKLRRATKNTLHLTAVLMSDRLLQIHGRMIQATMEVMRSSVQRALKQHRAQLTAARWAAERAQDCCARTASLRRESSESLGSGQSRLSQVSVTAQQRAAPVACGPPLPRTGRRGNAPSLWA